MADSERYDANVAAIEEYLSAGFPDCPVSSYRYNPANTEGFDIAAHTFTVDAGEWHFLVRATEELLREFTEQDVADYLRVNDVAGKMRGAAARSNGLLLKRTGTEERSR